MCRISHLSLAIIDGKVVTFLCASSLWRQIGQALKHGAHWLQSGKHALLFDSFFRQIYAHCDSFAGSAERGTLSETVVA